VRIVVTGAAGMLGCDVVTAAQQRGQEVLALTRADLDITDVVAVRGVVRPGDVIVNCAGWTDVDRAESQEVAAARINAAGPGTLAAACQEGGARLVHMSTDYVFSGTAKKPYPEDAPLAPRSAYGRSKAAGERAVRELLPDAGFIVRTAWLYGEHGRNFVSTMMRLERSQETVDVVDDQRGQPTWTRDVAARVMDVVELDLPSGIYHATSSDETTWFGLARAVFAAMGADPDRVRAARTKDFPRPAPRPAYSVLGHGGWVRLGLEAPRDWRSALEEAVPVLRAGLEAL